MTYIFMAPLSHVCWFSCLLYTYSYVNGCCAFPQPNTLPEADRVGGNVVVTVTFFVAIEYCTDVQYANFVLGGSEFKKKYELYETYEK